MNMAEWLILRLPRAADGNAGWLVADAEGRPLQPLQSGPLAAAAPLAAGRRVVGLVPASEVLLAEVELPQGAAARAAQLVPYALEEQLVGDIDEQHFAVGRAGAGPRTPVAVVAHGRMADWLGQLRAAGIEPAALHAEHALLPAVPGQAIGTLEGTQLCLRAGAAPAHSLEAPAGSLGASLELLLGEARAATALMLYASPGDWQARRAEIEALQPAFADLKVQLLNQGLLPWLAAHVPAAQPINLLQGRYQPSGDRAAAWLRWRPAAALAAALLLVHVGVQGVRLWQMGKASAALEAQLAELGAAVPPGAGSLRARGERALLALADSGSRAGLLPALQALADALRTAPGARVLALDFHDGAVQLKLHAADAQALQSLSEALRAGGWQAQVLSGAAAAGGYEGSLRLTRGAS